jgi:hypothetical protein
MRRAHVQVTRRESIPCASGLTACPPRVSPILSHVTDALTALTEASVALIREELAEADDEASEYFEWIDYGDTAIAAII